MTDPRIAPKESIRQLRGYEEEAHGGLNLSNNANLFGANPAIAKTLARLAPGDVWDYPSLTGAPLRERLGRKLGVPASWIVTGNGSNDLIDVCIRAFADAGSPVAYHPPTFPMIPIFSRTNGADARPVPLGLDFSLDPKGLVDAKARITFVVSPNNPTGNAFSATDILRVVDAARGIVVVDEAYIEFGGSSVLEALRDRPNMILLRTFSKAHGLAGLRVGYAVAHEEVAEAVAKVRGPFRMNAVSELAATLALDEDEWLARTTVEARRARGILADGLSARGFHVHPSDANFVLARVPEPFTGKSLAAALASRDVWIRDLGGDLLRHVRITAAPPAALAAFFERLDAVLKETRP